MRMFFSKAWIWIKKYWKIFALIGGALIGLILFRNKGISFSEDFQKIKDSHDEELRQINLARDEEKRLMAENDAKLKMTLKIIEDSYAQDNKELNAKKKSEIEKIVKEENNDPDKLAKRLADATGFQIILPKN